MFDPVLAILLALQRYVAEYPALLDICSTHCASPAINQVVRTVQHSWRFSTAC
jgi:hypothetical protein